MRILVLSFYFKPDLSAGSFRNTIFVDELCKKISDSDEIFVLCSTPNRYSTFKDESLLLEKNGNTTIIRVDVGSHKSGFLDQIVSFSKYFFFVLKFVRKKDFNLIYASSSRLFTAFLAAIISKLKKIPLFLDIRDIFVDTITDVIKNAILMMIILKPLKIIEKFTINTASKLNLISPGFNEYFSYYSGKTYNYTNGIDDEFLNFTWSYDLIKTNKKSKVVLYAGNIGEGQGLDYIIPQMAKLYPNIIFKVIGDGGKKNILVNKINENKLENVILSNPVKREELLDEYNKADYLFLHLNNYSAFLKVLPSKIFEYGATLKPIIAGVGGFSKKFIEENVENSIVFSPCNINEFHKKFDSYLYKLVDRKKFKERFARRIIMSSMAINFLKLTKELR